MDECLMNFSHGTTNIENLVNIGTVDREMTKGEFGQKVKK